MAKEENRYSMKHEFDLKEMTLISTLREKDENGKLEDIDQKVFPFSAINEKLVPNVSLYGLSKVLQDRTSDVKPGLEKLDAMKEVLDQIAAGNWEKARVVGSPIVSCEVEALAELKGISIPDVQKNLKKYDKDQRESILSNPVVKAKAEEIRTRRESAAEASFDDLVA